MSGWDIQLQGAYEVVGKTVEKAQKFEDHGSSYATAIEDAIPATGSGIVGKALVDFANHHKESLTFVAKRASRVITAGADAMGAYVQGDLDMAADAQRRAYQVEETGNGQP